MQGSETQVRWSVAAVAELLEEQRFAEARTSAAAALDAAGETPELVLLAAFAAGEVERHYGDPGRAFQYLDRALTVCQGLAVAGTEPTLRAATCHLAWAEVALHVPDVPPEAIVEVLDAAERLAVAADDLLLRARAALVRARISQCTGHPRMAATAARDAALWARLDRKSKPEARARVLITTATLAAELGHPDAAAEWLDSAWRDADRSPATSAALLLGIGRLAMERGRPEDALDQARSLCQITEGLGHQARLAAWVLRSDAARAAQLVAEAASCGWRIVHHVQDRGARDELALQGLLAALDGWMDAEEWESAEIMLPEAARIAQEIDISRGGHTNTRSVNERRARWYVEHRSVDPVEMRPTA